MTNDYSRPRVLVIGNNTIDLVFSNVDNVALNSKSIASKFDVYAGGQAANVAYSLQCLGAQVSYVGIFGNDNFGVLSKNSLEEIGIETDHSNTLDLPNQIAVILVDKAGNRSIVMHLSLIHI